MSNTLELTKSDEIEQPGADVPKLYAHPFSSYCQKVLIALYENGTRFDFRMLDDQHPENMAELEAAWPFRKFPVLLDGGRAIAEASIIIEYPTLPHPGPVRLIPTDATAALDVRFMDRFFDNYVSMPQQKIVFDQLREPDKRDAPGVTEARTTLEKPIAGWMSGWPGENGRAATNSASPIAVQRRFSSMPTGPTALPMCTAT